MVQNPRATVIPIVIGEFGTVEKRLGRKTRGTRK